MSLTQDHGDYVFQCDTPKCRETLETNTSNFEAAQNRRKRAGWKPFKPAGADEWSHRCGSCVTHGASA